MKIGCCRLCFAGISRFLVFTLNLGCVICGLVLLILGIVYKLDIDVYLPFPKEGAINVSAAPILLIIVGSIIFVTAFLGCCGAWSEVPWMLTVYAVALICFLLMQIATGVYALVIIQKGSTLKQEIQSETKNLFEKYRSNDSSTADHYVIVTSVDTIQQLFSCCGFENKDSYNGKLPPSCCNGNKDNCNESDSDVFPRACKKLVYNRIERNLEISGYVALGLGITEALAIIFSFCLCCSLLKGRRPTEY